ncbi:MAG: SUF system NifU family Fe-S cluster assembly protein [Thermoplasmata archaeon]|nr:SUF system NifU family Fe-S cluster assembly protein [Thermoplasmata archaeon]
MAYDMYQEVILQHYRAPRNFGTLADADFTGEESNPLCGDRITLQLKLGPDHHSVSEVRFHGDGCAISVASASMLTEKLKGQTLESVAAIQREDVLKLIGIPLSPVRVKCALTGFAALGRALHPAEASTGDAGPSVEGTTPA